MLNYDDAKNKKIHVANRFNVNYTMLGTLVQNFILVSPNERFD